MVFAILCLVPIAANQYINHRSKLANTDPWIVSDVVSGDRFIVENSNQTLEVKLCGISVSEGSKDYLRSAFGWHCVVCRRQGLRDRF